VSASISISTAVVPDAPSSPTTTVIANNIHIAWTTPSSDSLTDYGAVITSYQIMIESHDGVTFYEDVANCDGSSSAVISSTQCEVPMSILLGTPFLLTLDQSVYAKVSAINSVGSSSYSVPGNGAVISMSYPPDAPVSVERNSALTTKTQISFTWEDGSSNGGQTILDYRVSYDQGAGIWVEL
jgi:hypothetical protein